METCGLPLPLQLGFRSVENSLFTGAQVLLPGSVSCTALTANGISAAMLLDSSVLGGVIMNHLRIRMKNSALYRMQTKISNLEIRNIASFNRTH